MSGPAVRVAVAGIAVGIVVMLLTIAIAIGFKREIRNKIIGFGSHIQVVNFDNNNTYQMQPIWASDSLLDVLRGIPEVASVETFCTKPGIIKTDDAFQGIVLKGRSGARDAQRAMSEREGSLPEASTRSATQGNDFFQDNLVEGVMPAASNEVLLSATLARKLHLQLGDRIFCHFIDQSVRTRRYTIVGLYDTRFADYDELFVIGMMEEVQRLAEWDSCEVGGIEIRLRDFSTLYTAADKVYDLTANRPDAAGNFLYTQTVEELNPAIFSWLRLLDMNVVIIIILMLCVSGLCIISGLIILILDSIQMIGLLKALGATNRFLRQTFLYEAFFLIGKGMLWGNIVGLGFCVLQYYTHLLPLDPQTYYVSYVPIALSPWAWLLLNLGTLAISMLVVLGPSAIVSKISPAKVMHFE